MSNYPDDVSPSDAHFQGPTPDDLEEQDRLEEIADYLKVIGDAEVELEQLDDTLIWLDNNYPGGAEQKTLLRRAYSFFTSKLLGPMYLLTRPAIRVNLEARLRELREKTEDLQ